MKSTKPFFSGLVFLLITNSMLAQTPSGSNTLPASGVASIASTTSASYQLSINGAIKQYGTGSTVVTSPTHYLTNTTATTGRAYGINSDNTGLFQVFDATASNAARLVINGTGNVGIGNTAPNNLVDIGSAARSAVSLTTYPYANNLGLQVRTTNTANTSSSSFVGNMFYTSQAGSGSSNKITGLASWITGITSGGSFSDATAIKAVVETPAGGSVYATYGVSSKIITAPSTGVGYHYAFHVDMSGATIGDSYGLWIGPSSATNKYGVVVNDANALNLFGKVGIGTSNIGTCKLAVEGMIGAREVRVTAGAFPDYVFDEKYNLMSLDKLDQYIGINKHLPNIPSAKEIEENGGVELGKMNIKLVEKVEELTLYIIDLNKRLKQIEEENELLKINKIK